MDHSIVWGIIVVALVVDRIMITYRLAQTVDGFAARLLALAEVVELEGKERLVKRRKQEREPEPQHHEPGPPPFRPHVVDHPSNRWERAPEGTAP